MKKYLILLLGIIFIHTSFFPLVYAQDKDEIGQKVKVYFETLFSRLKDAAGQAPTRETFRQTLKPLAESIDGFYGATLVDSDWVIREVYFPSHFLARGYDLKKVKELEYFYRRMQENPAPQLSEPGHGSILQPRLIAMRYPIMKEGKFIGFISLMLRTQAFLKAVGLDKARAYKITCLGKLAEQEGELSAAGKEVTVELPSTKWEIRYE